MELFRVFGSVLIDNAAANAALEETDRRGSSVASGLGDMAGLATKAGLAFAAMGAAAVGGMVVKGVMASDELQKSLNGLLAKTGYSKDYMAEFGDTMKEIYAGNFGESFEDIGQAMASIAQQTGKTGEELKELTTDAIAMRDTFDMDVNESIRAANMMMAQFGISGEEAYNLIAQGAQNGLDKNGDLLDTINEYSVHFKQLGFESDEMFNMLVNGAKNGTFSVDKLGDAVKEFGIRVKDDSKGTNEAFTALGLNAKQTGNDFASGGEKGRQAFQQVTEKLLSMKDPMAQNAAGVALFGTMWEDLGVKGIEALTNVNGQISTTSDSLNQIKEIKYDSFGEAIAGIGRQFVVGLFVPIGEKILPILNQFATWISSNMPNLESITNTALAAIAIAFDGMTQIVNTNVIPALTKLYEWIKPYIPDIQKIIEDAFNIVTTIVIPALVGVFESLVNNTFPLVNDAFNFVTEKVIPPLNDIITFLFTEIVPKLAETFKEWIPLITDIMREMWGFVEPIITDLINAFETAWPAIKVAVTIAVDVIKNVVSGLLTTLKGILQFISGVFTGDWGKAWEGVKNVFSGIWTAIGGIVSGVWSGILAGIKAGINSVIKAINSFINNINSIKISIPQVDIPGVGKVGGGTVGFPRVPNIPMLAKGGNILDSGSVIVGENGPEILSNIKGAKVTPLDKTASQVTNNFNIANMTVRDDNDIKKVAKELFDLQKKSSRVIGGVAY